MPLGKYTPYLKYNVLKRCMLNLPSTITVYIEENGKKINVYY